MQKENNFNFHFSQKVNWGDMDAFGHVNNVSMVRYFENARADYFTEKKIWNESGKLIKEGMILVNLEFKYRKQLFYPSILDIAIGITSISSRKFVMECRMVLNDELYSQGIAELIWYDFIENKPKLIPDNIKFILQS